VRDVPYQLYGFVYDLLGAEDCLQLRGDLLVYEVLVEVKAGGGQQRAGVVVKVGGYTLPFFFLGLYGSGQQELLLLLFHTLHLHLVLNDPALVKDDKDNQGYG
jgi:hypothetical protein